MTEEYLHVRDITIERMKNLAGTPGMLESGLVNEKQKPEQRTKGYVGIMPESYLG